MEGGGAPGFFYARCARIWRALPVRFRIGLQSGVHVACIGPLSACIGHRTGYSLHENARISGLASADFEGELFSTSGARGCDGAGAAGLSRPAGSVRQFKLRRLRSMIRPPWLKARGRERPFGRRDGHVSCRQLWIALGLSFLRDGLRGSHAKRLRSAREIEAQCRQTSVGTDRSSHDIGDAVRAD